MKKYEQAKRLLSTMEEYNSPDDFSNEMVAALTSDFDRLFELTWKFIKEYLQHNLMIRQAKTGSPKEILKLAYQEGLIDDENIWLSMLKDRNDDTHLYHHGMAILYTERIRTTYLPEIRQMIQHFSDKIPDEPLSDDSVPEQFFTLWKASGLKMDEYIEDLRVKNNLASQKDVFSQWETIKK